jgi:hypothetical protein
MVTLAMEDDEEVEEGVELLKLELLVELEILDELEGEDVPEEAPALGWKIAKTIPNRMTNNNRMAAGFLYFFIKIPFFFNNWMLSQENRYIKKYFNQIVSVF